MILLDKKRITEEESILYNVTFVFFILILFVKMTNIINMTPHAVHIVDAEGTIITTFPKGESMIRLAVKTVSAGTIAGVSVTKTEFGQPEGCPSFVEGTYYIVSQLVKSALADRTDLLVPAEVVRDTNGNILGCKSLGI